MIIEFGLYALVLSLATAIVLSVLPVIGAWRGDANLMAVAPVAALGQFALVTIAFGVLMHAHLVSDFSVVNVWQNSHSLIPTLYKVSGVWGNHEGSMMLWLLILSLFSALVAIFGGNLPASLKANVLAVQGWISAAFILFIVLTSNPFLRMMPPPPEGRDLNPVLQDVGLAIHPPLLYLGYVGFSVCFSFAVAALMEGRIDAAWARWVRPWALAAWTFLTAGIAMGSYWAYYELGWGGWWFWDPVENASFMPWLAGTALLHSALVMEKARSAEDLDRVARDPDFLALPAWHLPCPLGCAHLRARLRQRSIPRCLHPGDPRPLHRRRADAVCVACRFLDCGWALRPGIARRCAGPQQPHPHRLDRDRPHRHALSHGAGIDHRREDFRRSALLQPDLRPADAAAASGGTLRALARLEAG